MNSKTDRIDDAILKGEAKGCIQQAAGKKTTDPPKYRNEVARWAI